MGAPNPYWDRWILASVSKHFEVKVPDLHSFVEGMHDDRAKKEEHFEIRVDGPYCHELSKDYWRLVVEINCLVSTRFNEKNFHTHRVNTGKVLAGFTSSIEVLKYGTPGDNTRLGCLQIPSSDNEIEVAHFGQVNPDEKLQQSTIEAHYWMELRV